MKFKEHVSVEQSMLFHDPGPSIMASVGSAVDMDKPVPYIECCIAKQEPITKVTDSLPAPNGGVPNNINNIIMTI